MCTLIIARHVHYKYPLIIGANRDEAYTRQSSVPKFLHPAPIAAMAPKDNLNGGTWIGAALGGWFVGLTNQDAGGLIMGKQSRGDLVRRCLLMNDPLEVTRYLVKLNPSDYNPFNLVFGNADGLFLCRIHEGLPVDLDIIHDGVTVIANDCTDTNKYSRRELKGISGGQSIAYDDNEYLIVSKLKRTLSLHDDSSDPYQSLCVHDETNKYGTKSSTVMLFSRGGDVSYYHNEGHPCKVDEFKLHCRITSQDLDHEQLSSNDIEVIS